MTTIAQRIEQLLSKAENKEAAVKLLDVLRTNLRECGASFDRRVQLLIVAVVILELITQAGVSEFSFAGLKVSNLKLVQKILPLVIAYLGYSIASILAYRSLLHAVHGQIVSRLFPDFYKHNFELYEHPPNLFHTERILYNELPGRFASTLYILALPLMVLIVIGPTLYLGYAHFRLFHQFGLGDPILWISSVASLLLLITAWMQYVGSNRLN